MWSEFIERNPEMSTWSLLLFAWLLWGMSHPFFIINVPERLTKCSNRPQKPTVPALPQPIILQQHAKKTTEAAISSPLHLVAIPALPPPTVDTLPTTNLSTFSQSLKPFKTITLIPYSSNIYLRPCNRILPSDINTTGLTHLIFAFAAFDPVTFYITPVTQADYGLYPQFTSLKSKTLETWIAIGGSTFSQPGLMFNAWSDMTQSAANRAVFIQSLMQFFEDWGFQGVDLDWEFPGLSYLGGDSNDTENLVLLVKEMREAFGTKYGISSVL